MAARINARPHANGLREARLLVEHVTGHSVAAQIVIGEHSVPDSDGRALETLVLRREAGEPLARLTGRGAFWDFEVELNEATLIPRDDTGTLVDAALEVLEKTSTANIADLGTGSGIILLALASARPGITGLGIDIAQKAVDQARENAQSLDMDDRLSFEVGNWLECVPEEPNRPFDMIVSNPPYISRAEMEKLADEVRLYDPQRALLGGEDGLDAYRALLPQAAAKVKPGGHVLVEIGATQSAAVAEIGQQAGLRLQSTRNDLSGHQRVVVFVAP